MGTAAIWVRDLPTAPADMWKGKRRRSRIAIQGRFKCGVENLGLGSFDHLHLLVVCRQTCHVHDSMHRCDQGTSGCWRTGLLHQVAGACLFL